VCLAKSFTFRWTGRSAGKDETRQSVRVYGLRVILCGFLNGTNEVIERPFSFHLPLEDKNPIRFRELGLLGRDPGVLEIPRAREDSLDLGDFDEMFQLVWGR
jgi:hypothetical protein